MHGDSVIVVSNLAPPGRNDRWQIEGAIAGSTRNSGVIGMPSCLLKVPTNRNTANFSRHAQERDDHAFGMGMTGDNFAFIFVYVKGSINSVRQAGSRRQARAVLPMRYV